MAEIVGQRGAWATEMREQKGFRDLVWMDGVKKRCVPPVQQDVSKGGVARVIDLAPSTEITKQERMHFTKKCIGFLKSIDVFVFYLNI